MPWEDLITPFKDVLYDCIRRRGLNTRSFAKLAGVSQAFVSDVANYHTPPPLDRMEQWADILGLEGQHRDYFIDLAALEVVPKRCKRLFDPRTEGFVAIQMAISREMMAAGEDHPFQDWLDGRAAPSDAVSPPVVQSTSGAASPPTSKSASVRAASSQAEYRAVKKRRREPS
jgi:hypothetical protein